VAVPGVAVIPNAPHIFVWATEEIAVKFVVVTAVTAVTAAEFVLFPVMSMVGAYANG
jgi:hypothetical protein